MTKLSKLSLCLFFVLSIILSTQTMARTTSAVGVSHLTSSSGGLSAGGSGLQPNEFTGSAMYNIRIPVPPARGGIEPKILLTYDSARKNHNSIMGYGWNLDLGSIERLPGSFGNTNYYAGQHFRVRFAGQTETLTLVDENIDVASLYGLSFATGTRVDEYRATSQSAYNIYLHLRDTTDITDIVDMGWVVIDKNGRTYRFGEDSDSRYESQHTSIDDPIDVFSMNMQTWVSKWVLNSITDANGNQVTVRYGLYQLPSYISYQNIKIFFNFKSFTGGGLPYFPTFRDGYLNADHLIQQLEQVEIRDGLTVLQTFDFTYEQDAWNRHQKLSRIEHTGADGTTLPETEFEYYEQDDLEWSSASQIFTGTTTFWGVEQTGYDDSYLKFADMNGDGLVDKVVAHNYNHLPMLKVYHNNGVDFEDITNRSEWMDSAVSSCTDTFRCYGKLDAFYAHDGQLYQFAHLIDMNGDSLPDRVKANVAFDDGETILGTDMYVWINNGNGFDSPVPWDDPHEGPWAGCSNSERAFIDMNGDGLVDRVIGDPDEGGFWVYYNIGNAFKSTPSFWRDPVEEARGWHPHSGAGKIYEGTEVYNNPETTHTFIRDMNGDGLPDRVFKGTYANEEGEEDDQVAIAIAFNKNGVGWALPEVNDDTIIVDGVDVVSILDPIQDEESRGYISDTADWIDFNGDGFLDRVEGDPDTGVFRVYFFQGMQADEAKLELVGPYTFSDPISDAGVPDDWKGVGYISRGNFDDENINDRIHTFIKDMNGDGYPDRVTLSNRGDESSNHDYEIHYMEVNTLPFSETPATWITNEIPQPVGALKAVYNGQGKNTVIEYMPSSWPWQFSTNYPGLPITHRYLPFNRYLAHKIYETDYAAGTDTSYEAQRNPGMRWTTYQYYGGNLFFKQGSYLNTPVVDETDISTLPFTEFNGFQKIIKTVHKFPGETWDNFETTTLFQQAIGDTNPVEASDETYFEQQPYGHFYFSGKIHSRRTESDSGFSQEENYTYDINWTAWNDEFDCLNDAACEPRLIYHEKEVKDSPAAVSRFHSVDYEHDDWGNVTHRTIKDGTNATLIEEDIDYYDVTNFDSNIQLRSRPQYMTKELGSVLRQTEYIYDNNGNPLQDAQLVSGSSYEYITRTFDNYGNVETEMNIDNVTTQFAYDTEHTYPTEATVNLPTGGTYTITRDYNYLNGAVISEINEHAVGQNIDYDDFGRPVTEYIVDAAGNQTITKEYEYSFETATIDGWPDQTLIKTQIYEPKTGYADTETTPSVITYSDANGFTLQECYYTERQDYRLAQMRKYDLGQIEVATEPQFANDCTFISSITTSRLYTTQKDFLGREIYVESPTGDANSPVGFVNISYDTDASGNLIKTSTTSAGDTTIEKFDAQNRLVEITNPQNTTLSYVYNAIGDLEEVWSNGIKLTEIEYDKLGRKTQMYDANLGTWSYEYNSNNKLYKQTDNKGQYIIHQYDSLARLSDKSTYDAGGSLEKQEVYTYDTGDMAHDVSRGELYTVEEFDGSGTLLRTTRFGYDSDYRRVGKITRTIEGVGDFEQDITYNDRGDVTSNTLPGGLSLNYTYNRTGQIEALCETADCNAASGEVYYYLNPANAFDAFGAVLREEYGNGVVVENDYYSNSHRLQNRKVYKGSAVYSERNYTYDVYSNITSLGDAQNQTGANAYNNIVYDSLNRLTDFTHTTTGTATSLQYDSFGNITQNSTYGADPYQYTSAKPHAVTQIGSDTFTYDDNGNMVRDPNRQMVYNAQNQLTQVTMTNGTVANYEYDYTGARVKKHTSHPTIYMTTEESTTHYLGDAVEVRGDKIHINIFAGGKKVATRCLGEVNEIMGWAASSLRPVNLKPQNRLAAYIPYFMLLFVLGIFLLFRPVPKLSFNARRRIPGFVKTYFAIARGFQEAFYALPQNLAPKMVSIALSFLFIISFPMSQAYAGDSGVPPTLQSDEAYFFYVHSDHLGSSHVMTEGNAAGGKHVGLQYARGELIQRIEYNPFGEETYVLNPNLQTDPEFTGQKYDLETGLYYYKARYYNPKLARFIQADTVVPNPTNLQDYNRYSYAANNPLKYIDPSGHEYEAPGDNDSDFYFEDDNGDPMDYSFDQDIGSFDDYDVGGGDQSYSDPDNSTVSAIPADSIYTGTIFDYESWEPYASLDVEDYVSDANFLKIVVGITNIVRGVMSLCKAASTVIITAVAIYSGVGIPFSPLVLAVGAYQLFIAFPGLTKRGFQQLREGLGVNAREMKLGYAVNLKGLLPFGQDLDDPTEGVGHALDKKKDLLNSIGNKAFVEPWNAAKEFYEKIILDFSM